MMKIEYRPIGIVHSPFTDISGVPIQPSRAEGIKGDVTVFPEFAEGLSDLDGFSHVVLLCHLDRVRGVRLKVVPFRDTVKRGVFSTRAPCRPNPIGLSIVRLAAVKKNKLVIEGVDVLDGTPVLDIKPYIGAFNRCGRPMRYGWLDESRDAGSRSDDRFT